MIERQFQTTKNTKGETFLFFVSLVFLGVLVVHLSSVSDTGP